MLGGLAELEEERRREVKGRVAHHAQPPATLLRHRRKVELQHIAMDQVERWHRFTQDVDHAVVELDGGHAGKSRHQMLRNRALPRPQLHHARASLSGGSHAVGHLPRKVCVDEEVLAEGLLGLGPSGFDRLRPPQLTRREGRRATRHQQQDQSRRSPRSHHHCPERGR